MTRRCLACRLLSRGYSLVEVLVALLISVIIMGSIYAAYATAARSFHEAEAREDLTQTARVILTRINTEISCTYHPGDATKSTLSGDNSSEDTTQSDTLTVLTTGHSPFSATTTGGDVCQVTYFMSNGSDGNPAGLYAQEDYAPGFEVSNEDSQPVLVSDAVTGFICRYMSATDTDWEDSWLNETTLPMAVRVELILKPPHPGGAPITVASTANIMISQITPATQTTATGASTTGGTNRTNTGTSGTSGTNGTNGGTNRSVGGGTSGH